MPCLQHMRVSHWKVIATVDEVLHWKEAGGGPRAFLLDVGGSAMALLLPSAQQEPQYCGMRWFLVTLTWLTPSTFLQPQLLGMSDAAEDKSCALAGPAVPAMGP